MSSQSSFRIFLFAKKWKSMLNIAQALTAKPWVKAVWFFIWNEKFFIWYEKPKPCCNFRFHIPRGEKKKSVLVSKAVQPLAFAATQTATDCSLNTAGNRPFSPEVSSAQTWPPSLTGICWHQHWFHLKSKHPHSLVVVTCWGSFNTWSSTNWIERTQILLPWCNISNLRQHYYIVCFTNWKIRTYI